MKSDSKVTQKYSKNVTEDVWKVKNYFTMTKTITKMVLYKADEQGPASFEMNLWAPTLVYVSEFPWYHNDKRLTESPKIMIISHIVAFLKASSGISNWNLTKNYFQIDDRGHHVRPFHCPVLFFG
jgi:hypothetical protein